MDLSLSNLVDYSLKQGRTVLVNRSETQRKRSGQFLTPAAIARYMAKQLGPIFSGDRILDPAIGSGVLACAMIERLIAEARPLEIWLDGYETDPNLAQLARQLLHQATQKAAEKDIIIHTQVYERDFVLNALPVAQPRLFLAESSDRPDPYSEYSHIISNPPYFKLNSKDSRVEAVAGQVKGHTNIYTLFLALSVKKLIPNGLACFIVPRSFCSGTYFSALRRDFFEEALPRAVHLFTSRQNIFKEDAILQENIIFTFQRRKIRTNRIAPLSHVEISTSKSIAELGGHLLSRRVSMKQFLGKRQGKLFFRLPTGEFDEQLVKTIDSWPGSLIQYSCNVSTGPVVAFRAKTWLTDAESVIKKQAAPLLWMQNVKRQKIRWPLANENKPQGLSLTEETRSLLLPTANYVLLRRFSAKEEARRLVATPFLADQYRDYPWLGLENHLNYIYKKQGFLDKIETLGLAVFFNSALIDRYFRIVNGNTQVNATELRALPLPPLEIIRKMGEDSLTDDHIASPVDLEEIVFNNLRLAGYLPLDFPLIRETRITMEKIQEAQDALKALGLPTAQQNEISALTLLVLAQLSEETPWSEAKQQSLRIHDILIEIKDRYGREYAENTRETIRRQVIHQFEQAGVVVRNPDDPTLATNSPRTHYALSNAALHTIQTYRTPDWQQMVQDFVKTQGSLLEIY